MKEQSSKEQATEKQPPVRPGFLILGALSIIMAVVWLWVLKPKPQTQLKQNNVNNQNSNFTINKNKEPVIEQITEHTPSNINEIKTSRDPFLPPLSLYSIRENNEKPNLTSLNNDPTLLPVFDKPKESLEELIKPVLKGIVGTLGNKVVIIQFKNKTYLLKNGDQIPESKYKISEINADSILVTFPDGKFSLGKK